MALQHNHNMLAIMTTIQQAEADEEVSSEPPSQSDPVC